MNQIFKKTLLAFSCAGALFLSACNDDTKDEFKSPQYSSYVGETAYIKETPTAIAAINAASVKTMTYNMTNVAGQKAQATALVFFPKTEKPKDGWRVVVWEHGTVGVADACAPSNNVLNANFAGLAKELLAAGYVIVAPDYEGLGSKGIHPYLNMISEANSAIDVVKAFKEKYGNDLNGAWMSVGQSQGGQASIGTAEFAAKDDTYKGAVAGAPASSLGTIILDVAPLALAGIEVQEIAGNVPLDKRVSVQSQATLLAYAALAGIGIKAYEPRFDYSEIFQERTKAIAELGEGSTGENGLCLSNKDDPELSLVYQFQKDIIKFMTANPDKKLKDYPGLNEENFRANKSIKKFLSDSQPGTKRIDKPLLILQGEADTNVPALVTKGMVKGLVDLGSPNVELVIVPKATHTEAIVKEQPRLLNFVQKYMPAQ
ncbi:alpha-beta hydrolase superfamily lysophospholipase [Acinetobacter calcoaceticus]|uniref:Alpha-beta hydrolase superfamily lysophospholipase n=1 Tax=Acinetobacter calcoaceticus TaxID=471 RepID=A0A4V2R101_ACICA|nr:alpha-beta hydrolase superfamily lysophospholipase [Acinetobacter calcoaceticus]